MKNFVFLSPNFPENYWRFCRELKNNGLRVLGIGDCPYENLSQNLKDSLHEYYKVDNLENYDAVYKAMGYFIHKYGRIDWLESNNEYWLERDAHLRTDFNITTGLQVQDIPPIKYKSERKSHYAECGIPAARYHLVQGYDDAKAFIDKVSYPVVVKPDNGVGATNTYKIANDDELRHFFKEVQATGDTHQYIMEEFVRAEVNSYDAIINSQGEPIFETGNVTPMSIMDIVNQNDNSVFYIVKELPEDIRRAGRACIKSFGVKSRFVHFEFFRLIEDMDGLGKKGDVIGLEVNLRPSGGVTPDMINFAHSTDVYKIWADMIAFDHSTKPTGPDYYCIFSGRRNGKNFRLTHQDLLNNYGYAIKMHGPVQEALSGAMANYMYLANFSTKEELDRFFADSVAVW